MNKRERENYLHTCTRLEKLGFSGDEIETLFRIERALARWHERECNGIEYREGVPFEYMENRFLAPNDARHWRKVRDMGKGARARLASIMQKHPTLGAYVQGDPRGCALYVYAQTNMPENVEAYYSSKGVAVCY